MNSKIKLIIKPLLSIIFFIQGIFYLIRNKLIIYESYLILVNNKPQEYKYIMNISNLLQDNIILDGQIDNGKHYEIIVNGDKRDFINHRIMDFYIIINNDKIPIKIRKYSGNTTIEEIIKYNNYYDYIDNMQIEYMNDDFDTVIINYDEVKYKLINEL